MLTIWIWGIIISTLWALCGFLSVAMWRGWKYYVLYPKCPNLGTPDEQLAEDKIGVWMYIACYTFGPFGFFSMIISSFIDKDKIYFKF